MTWRMLDLFSGIGGFSLAAQWCWGDELEIVAFCEIDKFCQKVLRKHWPDVPIIEDVRDVTKKTLAYTRISEPGGISNFIGEKDSKIGGRSERAIDLLTGGFPCQPFSVAGKRKGKEDNRFLWPEMFRVIKEIRPHWVIAENVAGIVRMALDDCLSDLEGEGYSTGTVIIPACAVNAPHRRDRVWLVAHLDQFRQSGKFNQGKGRNFQEQTCLEIEQCSQDVADTEGVLPQGCNRGQREIESWRGHWWATEPDVGRVATRLSEKLDGGRLNEILRMVREGIDSTSLEEWCIRQHIQESEVLQLKMLWSMVDKQKLKSNNSGNSQKRSTENRSKNMSRMWSDNKCSKTPREQKTGRSSLSEMPYEQGNEEWDMGNPWIQEPNIPRVTKGIKERVNRLKSLGNAIVPQVAYQIMKAIKEVEEKT